MLKVKQKKIFKKLAKYSGFSLIEILVAISFVGVMTLLIVSASVSNGKLRYINEEMTKVLFYSTEALEATKLMNWNDLAAGDYAVVLSGNTWILNSGSQLLDDRYTRTINISDVYRLNSANGQAYGQIVTSGGYLDPDTKKVTVNVSWFSRAGVNRSQTFQTYLHRWKAERWTQTDWIGGSGQSDWSDSTQFATKDLGIDISVAGIATLQSGFIDWSEATTTANFDTAGNFDENDVYEIDDLAFLVTENNSSGSEFYVLDVSNIDNPVELASLNIGSAVNSVVARGDYVYLATDGNSSELVTINVANPSSPSIVDTYDITNPDNDNAYDVVVDDTELYLARGSYLYSFSLIDPANPSYLDRIGVGATARELFLSENYVYIATEEEEAELQIIDVSNPANLDQIGEYDLPGNLKGTDVYVLGNTAYISIQNNGGGPELFIFEISDPSTPVYIGDYELGETIHSFAIVGPYALIGTNFLNEELTVVDISVPASPSKVSGFDLSGYVLGMSANCSVIYAATSSNYGEFFIISTEVLDCGYANYGELESSTFDTGSDEVTYNWLSFTGSRPLDTDIKFQVATSNNLAGPWSFKGPDGTANTYYNIASQELINYSAHLNQRYMRYKLFLETSSSWEVPILEEVTISYSVYP